MQKPGKNVDGIISGSKAILNELIACRENGNSIAVWAPTLSSSFVMYSVEDIREGTSEKDMVIILKERDLHGKTLQTRVVYLREIEKVHPFLTSHVTKKSDKNL